MFELKIYLILTNFLKTKRKTASTSNRAAKTSDIDELNMNFIKMNLPEREFLNETEDTVKHDQDDEDEFKTDDLIEELNFKNQENNEDSNFEDDDDQEQVTQLVNLQKIIIFTFDTEKPRNLGGGQKNISFEYLTPSFFLQKFTLFQN